MISVPIFEAKNKLPQYVHLVEGGEQIVLTRYKKKVAILVSIEEYEHKQDSENFNSIYNSYKDKIKELADASLSLL